MISHVLGWFLGLALVTAQPSSRLPRKLPQHRLKAGASVRVHASSTQTAVSFQGPLVLDIAAERQGKGDTRIVLEMPGYGSEFMVLTQVSKRSTRIEAGEGFHTLSCSADAGKALLTFKAYDPASAPPEAVIEVAPAAEPPALTVAPLPLAVAPPAPVAVAPPAPVVAPQVAPIIAPQVAQVVPPQAALIVEPPAVPTPALASTLSGIITQSPTHVRSRKLDRYAEEVWQLMPSRPLSFVAKGPAQITLRVYRHVPEQSSQNDGARIVVRLGNSPLMSAWIARNVEFDRYAGEKKFFVADPEDYTVSVPEGTHRISVTTADKLGVGVRLK